MASRDELSIAPAHRVASRLAGMTALVTGAASGIGLEIARVFTAEGARVVAADVDAAALAEVLPGSPSILAEAVDVRDPAACERLVQAALAAGGGRLDVLVNNAGATIRGTIDETTDEVLAAALEVNLASVARLCRLAAPSMRAAGGGSIVNIASITALQGLPGAVAYTASKGGVTALTRAVAVELAPHGVRVNALCPSVVDSPMTHEHVATLADPQAAYRELLARQPMGRMASPRDVALAALFLASPESSFITAVSLPVDGGRHAI